MASTKQAVREATVSKTESIVLMKNMMRISISSICYMRKLFPDDCFKNKEYGNIQIHQLQGAKKDENEKILVTNQEAFLLTQWLEKGVFMALENEYLSSVTFAVYTKHPVTGEDLLLETYEFKVHFQGDGPAKINNVDLVSKDSVKNQAAKFIRSLTEFASTLEHLPDERWITLQLKYQDSAPEDYEPEYFKAAGSSILVTDRLPLVVNIGSIQTPNMDMKVKFAGLESLLFEDLCKIPSGSTPIRAAPASTLLQASSHKTTKIFEDSASVEKALAQQLDSMQVAGRGRSSAASDDVYRHVKEYVCNFRVASVKNCSTVLNVAEDDVRAAFDRLVAENILKPKGRGYQMLRSNVVTPAGAEADFITPPAVSGPASMPSAPRKSAASFAASQSVVPDSMEDIEESQLSAPPPAYSKARNSKPQLAFTKAVPAASKRKVAMDAMSLSQSSVGDHKRRKYSIIKDPILLHAEGANQ